MEEMEVVDVEEYGVVEKVAKMSILIGLIGLRVSWAFKPFGCGL